MGGLFVVLADSIDGFLNHLAQHAALDGHRIVGAGHGQARIIAGVQRGDLKFCHTAADFCLALVVQLNADIARRHTVDHGAQQFCVKYSFTRYEHVTFNRGRDAHFHIVAGQRQVKALGLHVDAFQHRDGGAVRDRAGNAVDGAGQQCFFAFKFHVSISFSGFFWKKASAKNVQRSLGRVLLLFSTAGAVFCRCEEVYFAVPFAETIKLW